METKDSTTGYAVETRSKKSNSEELIEYHEIKDTPFTIARNGDEWFVLMGKYRLTEKLKDKAEATKEAKSMTWFRIMQVISIMITDNENEKAKMKVLK